MNPQSPRLLGHFAHFSGVQKDKKNGKFRPRPAEINSCSFCSLAFMPGPIIWPKKVDGMESAELFNAIELSGHFTDVLYLTDQGSLPAEIKRLLKLRKLSYRL